MPLQNARRHNAVAAAALGALIAAVPASSAHAVDRYWVIENGLWSQGINWSPSAVPGPADNAIVNSFFGLSRINTTAIGSVASVAIHNSASVSISNQGSLLCAGDFVVGQYNGPGAASGRGALNILTTNPTIGFPGGLTVNGNLRLGVQGSGTVTQDAGTVRVANLVSVGELPSPQYTGSGFYTLTGTGHLVAKHLHVGNGTNHNTWGAFNLSGFGNATVEQLSVGPSPASISQTGGQMTISNHLSISTHLSSFVTYNLSGGTLSSASTYINDGVLKYTGGAASLGTLTVSGSGSIHVSGGGNKVLRANRVSLLDFDSKIDLSDNSMLLSNASPSSVYWDIRQGYNFGNWNGFGGITSSFAAATALLGLPHKTALGYGAVPEGTLIKYTFAGDATLDGVVNLQDFNRLAANFGSPDRYWWEGDFNYDGLVNLQDFNLLAANFGLSATGPEVTPDDWATLAAAIPEPTSALSLSGVAASALLRRRRRK